MLKFLVRPKLTFCAPISSFIMLIDDHQHSEKMLKDLKKVKIRFIKLKPLLQFKLRDAIRKIKSFRFTFEGSNN